MSPTRTHTINYCAATSVMLFLLGLWWVRLLCAVCQFYLFQLQGEKRENQVLTCS